LRVEFPTIGNGRFNLPFKDTVKGDSIEAIYGQVAGAFYGFENIPPRWVKAMKSSNCIDELILVFINSLPSM